ncbi:nucleoside diphosphate-linked moiety X motif 17 [Notechis scutatus]|uniref:Nucleoside diphosphate-linked moiety X motif 17 n=1 Tax=Notechis scutatus TaxID=8663 RepID=A0A6J1VGM0_9SAUR|nr:nucleoside diphosphate-linked moiety X motif 17 [Notechis scutatus]
MLAGRRVAVHVCRGGGFPQRACFEQKRGSPTTCGERLSSESELPRCPPISGSCLFSPPLFLPCPQLLDAGLRELQEETGLHLKDGQLCWELLALWESVYPPRLSQGLPQRHHIVVYLHLALHESHQQLQARLKPNEAEVSAVAWLDRLTLASIVATEDGAEGEAPGVGREAPSTVSIIKLEKGSAKTLVIPTAAFLATAPGENVECVSTGTKYALRQWLNMSSL